MLNHVFSPQLTPYKKHSLFVSVCMCTRRCMCVYMSTCEGQHLVFLRESSLELSDFPESLLSLLCQHWHYRNTPLCLPFSCRIWELNSSVTLSNRLPCQPRIHFLSSPFWLLYTLAESQLHTYAKAIPTLLHLALHHTLFETLHKARAHQPDLQIYTFSDAVLRK